jgi:small subunit ribosomal protein S16
MLTIRLQRTGRKNLHTFRLVIAEKARSAKGYAQEVLGFYLPERKHDQLQYKEDRIRHWIDKGASMSNTAARLLSHAGMKDLERFILPYAKRKKKSEAKAEKAGAAPASVESGK